MNKRELETITEQIQISERILVGTPGLLQKILGTNKGSDADDREIQLAILATNIIIAKLLLDKAKNKARK